MKKCCLCLLFYLIGMCVLGAEIYPGVFHLGYDFQTYNSFQSESSGYLGTRFSLNGTLGVSENSEMFGKIGLARNYGMISPTAPSLYGGEFGVMDEYSNTQWRYQLSSNYYNTMVSSLEKNSFSVNSLVQSGRCEYRCTFEEGVLSQGSTATSGKVSLHEKITPHSYFEYQNSIQMANRTYSEVFQNYVVASTYLNMLFETQNYDASEIKLGYSDKNGSGLYGNMSLGYSLFGSEILGGAQEYFTTLYTTEELGVNTNIMTNWALQTYVEPVIYENIIGQNLATQYGMVVGISCEYEY